MELKESPNPRIVKTYTPLSHIDLTRDSMMQKPWFKNQKLMNIPVQQFPFQLLDPNSPSQKKVRIAGKKSQIYTDKIILKSRNHKLNYKPESPNMDKSRVESTKASKVMNTSKSFEDHQFSFHL